VGFGVGIGKESETPHPRPFGEKAGQAVVSYGQLGFELCQDCLIRLGRPVMLWPELMDLLDLKCFGVGDGIAHSERFHASFFYRFPKTSLILDCGEPLSRSFKGSGLSHESFDRIFISHLHSDHFGGFFMFVQALWLEGRTRPLTVHLPSDAIPAVQQMLNAAYLFQDVLPFPLAFEPHKAGVAVELEDLRVTPFRTTHLDDFKRRYSSRNPGSYDAFCFLMETPELRIGHSSDLGAPGDLSPLLEQPLDLLVCELAHFSPEELFATLVGRPIRKLALVHLAAEYWGHRDLLLEQARQQLPGVEVQIPNDGEALSL
jgi:ribonuclease Z